MLGISAVREFFSWFIRTERRRVYASAVLMIITSVALIYQSVIAPPQNFPREVVVRIAEGTTLKEAAYELHTAGVIRSSFWFMVLAYLRDGERGIIAGDYYFEYPRTLFSVSYMLTDGDYGLKPVKVTIPEGSSVRDMTQIFKKRFNLFDTEAFRELAGPKEGYLYPETYYFIPNVTATTVVETLENSFYDHIKSLTPDILLSGKTLDELVIMASLIEREAYDSDARRLISSVLWNRIERGMPLQVDVTFDYINGKDTFDLTRRDLTLDSPYNTYKYPGLPPGPIASPSVDSLQAALYPAWSNYLYFLADYEGTVHFSETFEEHVEKKQKYLR
jgi:UPF0755 protein